MQHREAQAHVRWTNRGFVRDTAVPVLAGDEWTWRYPSGQLYEFPGNAGFVAGYQNRHDFAWIVDHIPTPTHATQGTISMKRTFFVNGPNAVLMSHTCEDISTELMVERADARLTGQPLDVAELMQRFPTAAEAAKQWGAMKAYLKRDNTAVGIFIMVTEHEPTESQMAAFARDNPPVPVNK